MALCKPNTNFTHTHNCVSVLTAKQRQSYHIQCTVVRPHTDRQTDRQTETHVDILTNTGALLVSASESHVTLTAISAGVVDTLAMSTQIHVN